MKICIITNLYPPYVRGGAELIAWRTARAFVKNGHDVCVITTHPDKKKSIIMEDYVKVIRFKPCNFFYYLDDFKHGFFTRFLWRAFDTFNFFSYFFIKDMIKKESPDFVVTHNLVGMGLLAARAIPINNHVHILHDTQLVNASGLVEHQNFFDFFYRYFTRLIFKKASVIISPSSWLLKEHEKRKFFPEAKTFVIPNPLDDSFFSNNINPHLKRNIIFMYAGQLEKHKGVISLIKSFKKIIDPEISLNIFGDGSLRDQIIDLIRDDRRIVFSGRVTSIEIKKHINESVYVCVPSVCLENQPTIILESYSLGVPVIANRTGGIPEIVSHEKTGFLYDHKKEDDLTDTLNKAVSIFKENKEKYILMSENARFFSESELSGDHYINRFFDAIKSFH